MKLLKRLLFLLVLVPWSTIMAFAALLICIYCGVQWVFAGESKLDNALMTLPDWIVEGPFKLIESKSPYDIDN